jgi:hypothetical protein
VTASFVRIIAVLAGAVISHAAIGAGPYEERLGKVLIEYRDLPNTQAVKRLVELHRALESLVKEVRVAEMEAGYNDRPSKKYWRKEYGDIGLYFDHYSGALEYSGKLLVEAHKRNPNSLQRRKRP